MRPKVSSFYIEPDRKEGIVKVTDNGEICYDYSTNEFVVYEETYADEVGRTRYPACASVMLGEYTRTYLGY